MPRSKSILKYFIEFTVIVLGVSASFWVEEYRETLQNKEEKFKVLNNLKIELDEIDDFSLERKLMFTKDEKILYHLMSEDLHSIDSLKEIITSYDEINIAVIDYRGFGPPLNRYNSIISEGTLKFVESDSIKQLLSQLHNTFFKYINANVSDEKIIQQKISLYLADNYPEIFLDQDQLSLDESIKSLRSIIKNDANFKKMSVSDMDTMDECIKLLQATLASLRLRRDKVRIFGIAMTQELLLLAGITGISALPNVFKYLVDRND